MGIYVRAFPRPPPPPPILTKQRSQFPPVFHPNKTLTVSTHLVSAGALNSPRGFGPTPKKKANKSKKSRKKYNSEEEEEEEEEEGGGDKREEGVIPEIVTNRMMSRMGVSVGAPLVVGLMFFPLFYYLKVVLKMDVPSWVPVIVSFIFFGTALLGVSYGIVSASWDPMREGSFLGWNEAQKNWPVFWDSISKKNK